ncbi:cell division protein FtsA [Candidatus Wolfebacteria bacterium]|nr:cell division protein FtsA [Candidatus Wolfebacteria bacterium]
MHIAALDLGTSQIKVLVVEIQKSGKLLLSGIFSIPSAGLRKGEIINLEEVVQPLKTAIDGIKKINKSAAKNIFINVGGSNVRTQNSRGIVAVSRADSEIYSEDVERVIKASQAINLGPNREIIHTITKEFVVDGIGEIYEPLGMAGNRLEVNSLIIDAFKPVINNLIKAIEISGGRVGGLIYAPLASSRAVLSKSQKELGVLMIDIGFGTTSMSVYEEGKLISANVFPIGSGNITNDLAIGLKCSIETAEKIKISFGSAMAKEVSSKEKIELNQIDESLNSVINKRFISEIIEVRVAEIFELINNELKLIGKLGQLPAGAVLTGGGAKMINILDLARKELKLPVQLGIPELNGIEISRSIEKEISDEAENKPFSYIDGLEFSGATGLLIWNMEKNLKENGWSSNSSKNFISKILKHFLP